MTGPFKMKGWSPFRQDVKKVVTSSGAGITKGQEVKRSRKPTYKEAWDNMSKEEKAKYESYAAFVEAAKKYKTKTKGTSRVVGRARKQ